MIKKLFPLLFVFLFAACSQDMEDEGVGQSSTGMANTTGMVNLTQDEYLSIAFDDPKELDEDAVVSLASDFLNSLEAQEAKTKTRSSGSDFTLSVNTKSYFSKNNISSTKSADNLRLPVYEVTVSSGEDKGVVYVSADERNAEVITYIPKAAQDEATYINSGSEFLVEWAKASSYKKLEETEKIRQELRDATVLKISKELGIDQSEVSLDKISDKILVEGLKAKPINQQANWKIVCKPIVKTEWSQGAPYNQFLKDLDTTKDRKINAAGCAVTAACQLMTAIKPTITINTTKIDWDRLASTPSISTSSWDTSRANMVGIVFKWAFAKLKAEPRFDNNNRNTETVVYTNYQTDFYKYYFNYDLRDQKYIYSALLKSFNNKQPSLIYGQGHAFILDGYGGMSQSPRDLYFHANLGWGGTGNGWYKLNTDGSIKIEAYRNITYDTNKLWVWTGLYKKNVHYIDWAY